MHKLLKLPLIISINLFKEKSEIPFSLLHKRSKT